MFFMFNLLRIPINLFLIDHLHFSLNSVIFDIFLYQLLTLIQPIAANTPRSKLITLARMYNNLLFLVFLFIVAFVDVNLDKRADLD